MPATDAVLEAYRSVRYFWEERGDITRWVGWDEAKPMLERECPQLVKAWRDYEAAEAILDLVVRSLPDA